MARVPGIRHEEVSLKRDENGSLVFDEARPLPIARHNPNLSYQEQDEHGVVRTYGTTHPDGNRKQRRYRQQHHPFFTKSAHPGRDWWRLMEAQDGHKHH